MRRLWHAYGFTLCFLTAGLIWVYLDIKMAHKQHNMRSYILQNTSNGISQHTDQSTAVSSDMKFHNIPNNTDSRSSQTVVSLMAASTQPPSGDPNTSPLETTTVHTSLKHIVAIVSYMRSGSTFTADILQHFPGTLYVFEPLHMVFVRIRQNKPLYYLNGTKRYLKNEDLTDNFVYDEIQKWFSCRFSELDVHSLADNFHVYFSRSMKKLIECWRPKRHTLRSMRECLPSAIQRCENAKHRLFKFIRVHMRVMERALEQFPHLQIVHLIRDPRGSLNSQVNVRKANWSDVEDNSRLRCSTISNDLNYTFNFLYRYPERIRILIYERLATHPLDIARRLFTFLGLPSYDYVLRYISKLTSEGRRDGNSYETIRGNSSKTAFSWRHQVTFSDVQIVDTVCQHMYSILGYSQMTSPDDLTNDSIHTHITPNLQGLL